MVRLQYLQPFCFEHPLFSAAMEVQEQVLLCFREGPKVVVPAGLVEKEGGQTWLRIRPSSYPIAKVFLGHDVRYKAAVRPSLSSSKKYEELRQMLSAHIMKGTEAPVEGDELFAEAAEAQVEKSKKKLLLQKAAKSIFVMVKGVECEFRTPKTWKEKDMVVRLNARQLTAIGDFLCGDLEGVFQKRKYERTGSFSRSAKAKSARKRASEDEGHDDDEPADDEEASDAEEASD